MSAFFARGKVRAVRRTFHRPGQMNKTEAAYAAHLELLKRAGEISDYAFEKYKLRLADNTFYHAKPFRQNPYRRDNCK